MPKICLLFLIVLISVFTASAQFGVGSGIYRSPFDLYFGSPLLEFRADVLDNNRPPNTKDTIIVDFASRQITFARIDNLTGISLWEFHYAEMDDFLRDLESHTIQSLWNEIAREQGRVARVDNRQRQTGLTFAMPAHLPRWATRIMGQEPPKLSITGNQKLELGVQRSMSGTKNNIESKQTSPIFKPQSNFNIRGSVGRLLHLEINLRSSSDDDFFQQARDQLSQIRIHYREEIPGELEDDIIQEVEIGKTSFQMPGQGLAGYSTGSNENLFGIRIRSRFGPLELTTIASIENVETSRKTINNNEQRRDTISELTYIKNRFFFLDDIFRQRAENRNIRVPNVLPERLQVYSLLPSNSAIAHDDNIKYAFYDGGGNRAHAFRRLENNVDYVIDRNRGVIHFTRTALNSGSVIGLLSEQPEFLKGNPAPVPVVVEIRGADTLVNAISNLWIMKNADAPITDSTYNLMLRNVYNVGTSDATNFELKVLRNISGARSEENESGRNFADILGLSENGILNRTNTEIFDLENGFMYIPAFATGGNAELNSNWPFSNPALGSNGEPNPNPDIYDDKKFSNARQHFEITTTSRRRSDRFNLDFGIVEGSERLWVSGGDSLIRNIDYTIDYGFGSVVLISTKARSADIIEASYQKESLFLLDKKSFIGINAKVDFPGIGRNSYMSSTVMWQLMDAKKMMPRVGTEPYNRFLFASNVRFDFAPLWMTTAINYIPLIEREAQSSATFDVEVAHSSVKSSARSGGEAYIDNFSTSARIYSLGTSHMNWFRAGPDKLMQTGNWTNSNQSAAHWATNPPAWYHYWYQPVSGDNRARRDEIYRPERGAPRNDMMNTLRLVVQAYPENQELREGISVPAPGQGNVRTPIVEPWAGITQGFNTALIDRSEDRFFEFWVRALDESGRPKLRGTLTIDFGEVGEDLSLNGNLPNMREDSEGRSVSVSEEDDKGLDFLNDDFEYWEYPRFDAEGNFSGWETLNFTDQRLGAEWRRRDPSGDNWLIYDRDNLENRRHANGTQGNRAVRPRPDSEVLTDGAFILETERANYFRYTIDLERITHSHFHNRAEKPHTPDKGWIHIRIPIGLVDTAALNELSGDIYQEIGLPQWSRIRHVRMLWRGMEGETFRAPGNLETMEFEGIQFVGNSWREQPYGDSITGSVTASILDSRTSSGYLFPRQKRLDSLSGEQATDYTLRLEYDRAPNNSVVLVSRRFENQQAMNLTNYKSVRFWAMEGTNPASSDKFTPFEDIWFVLRFGRDSATYYEYKTRRIPGWDNEGFSIELDDLTKLKLAWFNSRSERHGSIDTTIAVQSRTGDGFDSLRVYSETRISPTLSSISWIAFGIENRSGREFTGDVRINGFRATGISDYQGWATRASMRLNWSDFLENTMNFQYTDAHFRSMSDNVLRAPGTGAQVSSGVGSEIQMGRFLPDRMGVQIPVGGAMTASLQRPELRPNSDISLRDENNNPDGLRDMAGDFGRFIAGRDERENITEAQKYEKRGRTRRAYTSYNKSRTSEKVVPRLTADRIGVDYSLIYRDSIARMGEVPEHERELINREGFEQFHGDITISQRHESKLNYDFSPSRKAIETLSWSPLRNAKSPTLSRRIKTMSFNLLPERVIFDVANVSYEKRESYSSIQDVIDTTGQYHINRRPIEEVRMAHGLNMTYRPINPFIAVNYRIGLDRNFDHYIRHWDGRGVSEFTNSAVFRWDDEYYVYNVLFSEHRRDQNLGISFTPEITRWLTLSSNFGARYTQNMETRDSATYMRTAITSSFDVGPSLNFRRLFEDVSRRIKKENVSNGFGNVAKGFETIGFENVIFRYEAEMRLGNTFLDREYLDYGLGGSTANYMLYSFGVYNRTFKDYLTGNMNDGSAFGGVQNRNDWYGEGVLIPSASDERQTTQRISTSTSLRFPKPVDISVNTIWLGWTRTYSINSEIDRLDTTITFPEIRLGASSPALEQLQLVKDNFSTFRLDWGYNYRLINARTGTPSDSIQTNNTIAWGLSPLIGTTMRLRRIGLDLSHSLHLRFDTTETRNLLLVNPDADLWLDTLIRGTRKRTIENAWRAGYHIPGRRGRTIRLFRDQIVDINGDIEFGFAAGYLKTYYYYNPKRNLAGENQEYSEWSASLRPEMKYKFTRNIDAMLYYEMTRSITGREERFVHKGKVAMEITITF